MKENSQQSFNWILNRIFAVVLLWVRWFIVFFTYVYFDNFRSLSKDYWDLLIILFWGIGYFSTSIVMFYKKTLALKNNSESDISDQEKVSPVEALYYPVLLFLCSWFFISFITKESSRCWMIVWIFISIVYLILFWIIIYWFKRK